MKQHQWPQFLVAILVIVGAGLLWANRPTGKKVMFAEEKPGLPDLLEELEE